MSCRFDRVQDEADGFTDYELWGHRRVHKKAASPTLQLPTDTCMFYADSKSKGGKHLRIIPSPVTHVLAFTLQ